LLLQLQNLDKQLMSAKVRSVYHQLSCKPEVFREAQYGFVDRVPWQLVQYQLQNFREIVSVTRRVASKH